MTDDPLREMFDSERREERRARCATSLEAYRRLRDSGTLSRLRWIVYDQLWHHGPLTRNELDAALRGPSTINASYSRRLTELEDMGLAARVGVRQCLFSGRNCEVWDVTDLDTPLPIEKPKAARDEVLFAIASDAVRRLEQAAMENGDLFAQHDASQLNLRLIDWRRKRRSAH